MAAGIEFDRKISLGHLLTVGAMVFSMVAAYYTVVGEVQTIKATQVERRAVNDATNARQELRLDKLDAAVQTLGTDLSAVRVDSADIKGSVRAIERDVANLLRNQDRALK